MKNSKINDLRSFLFFKDLIELFVTVYFFKSEKDLIMFSNPFFMRINSDIFFAEEI